MKRFPVIAAVVALLVAVSAPVALAAPGNSPFWDTSDWECNDETVTLSTHYGIWSAVYVPGQGHLILTHQAVVFPGGEVLFDLYQPGHTNPGPLVTCTVTDEEGTYFPVGTEITLEGFYMP